MSNQLTDREKTKMFLEYVESQNKNNNVEAEPVAKDEALCESCNKTRKGVFSHYGKQVCVSCSTMRGIAKSNPAAVVSTLKEFYTDSEIAVMFGAGIAQLQPIHDSTIDVEAQLKRIAALEEELASISKNQGQSSSGALNAKISKLERELAASEDKAERLSVRCNHLCNRLNAADAIVRTTNKKCEHIAWELVMAKLNSDPISVDNIMTLRKIGESVTVLVPKKMEGGDDLTVKHTYDSADRSEAGIAISQ